MWRYLLITLILSISLRLLSQEYQYMNFETGIWLTEEFHMTYSYVIQHYCNGDTLIKNTEYYKLFEYKIYYPIMGLPDTISRYVGAIRNAENKRITLVKSLSESPEIIYDFNLSIGDTIKIGYGSENNQVVQEIDSVMYCGVYHQRYITWKNLGDTNEIQAYIEGIGCSYGLINPIFPHFESYSDLICYTERQNIKCTPCELLLDNSSGTTENTSFIIYPNPVKDQIRVSSNYIIHQISIFNSLGKLIFLIPKIDSEYAEIKINFTPGIYLIRVHFSKSQLIKRFIVY